MASRLVKISLFAAIIFLSACTATKNHGAEQSAEFTTSLVPANFKLENSSLAEPAELLYRVDIRLNSESDIPEKARLTFHLRPGSNTVYLQSRALSLTAGGETFDWPGREWRNIYDSPPVRGRITTVRLSYDDLAKIANSKAVEGNLSGQNFEWSYQNREPIRQLIAKIDTEAPRNN